MSEPIRHLSRVTVSNIKRIAGVQVDIDDGALVIVSGANAQGKSSFIDAIWYALAGNKAMRQSASPVRQGERDALVELVLGEGDGQITVTRRWRNGGEDSTLTVRNHHGHPRPSPQAALNALVGLMAFDPLAFIDLSETAQVAMLVEALGIDVDLEALDTERRALYEQRTLAGRDVKTMTARLDGMVIPPPDTPDEAVSLASLMDEEARAQAHNAGIVALQEALEGCDAELEDAIAHREKLEEQLAELQDQLNQANEHEDHVEEVRAAAARAWNDAPEPVNVAEIRSRMAGVEAINANVAARHERTRAQLELARVMAEHDLLDRSLEELADRKRQALVAAAMPDPAISFADDGSGLLYGGVPLKDCSGAEQLKVACAMAMAAEPSIRVLRIADGSRLDSHALAAIEAMAAERDFQVLVEVVDETGELGIVFENGEALGHTGGRLPLPTTT